MFKPRYKIPGSVTKIHGIINERIEACPTFVDEWELISATLNGKTIVAYNAKFDRVVIARTRKMHSVANIGARWECAM